MKKTIDIPDELFRLAKARASLGGFDYGIRQSRHSRRYADRLDAGLAAVASASIDREGAQAYGAVRLELEPRGTPIPINEPWIAAIAWPAAPGRLPRRALRRGLGTSARVLAGDA